MRIYTLGYEGLGFKAYADILLSFGVGVVLDVREHPWSQKVDFIKSRFDNRLAEVGIGYIHIRSAGNPSHIRKTAQSAEECLSRYREHLNDHPACIGEVYSHARLTYEAGRPACLTCMEKEPGNCHRSVLAEALLVEDPQIEIVHLPLTAPVDLRRPTSEKRLARSLVGSSFLKSALLPFK
jgi:uncharacterized protein (DUF488 family)